MQGASDVVIVSEAVAKRFWPGQDPIGKRIKQGGPGSKNPWQTIVGVVNDMKYRALPNNPTNDPDLFWPVSERQRGFALVVRTPLDPASLAPAVRRSAARGGPGHRHLQRGHHARTGIAAKPRARVSPAG